MNPHPSLGIRNRLFKLFLSTACLGVALASICSALSSAYFFSAIEQSNLAYARALPGYPHIAWNPDDDISSLDDYIIKSRTIRKSSTSDIQFLRRITSLVAQNYKHGELHSHWSQDWISSLLSLTNLPKLSDFNSEINPSQIAKSKHAFCSQLAILMSTILLDHHINFQAIGFDIDRGRGGHFAIIAYADNKLVLIDPNLMPDISWDGTDTIKLLSNKSVTPAFNKLYPHVNATTVSVELKDWNRVPGQTARRLRTMLTFISLWIWIPALALLLYFASPVSLSRTNLK